jgi:hypothetical protein
VIAEIRQKQLAQQYRVIDNKDYDVCRISAIKEI